jgi:hypothetical protein
MLLCTFIQVVVTTLTLSKRWKVRKEVLTSANNFTHGMAGLLISLMIGLDKLSC